MGFPAAGLIVSYSLSYLESPTSKSLMKKIICSAAAILIASTIFTPIQSFAGDHVRAVRIAPPALRHEPVPAARRGYEWAPGFWNWNGHRYTWSRGHWERAHPGYAFRATTWEQADGGWRQSRGGWMKRDRDHDGVPDRADDHPHNPMRR
jgi:hypothetical protein